MCCLGLANPLDQIKDSKVLRVGVLKSNPPFSKFQDGVFEGFEIEFAKAISKDLLGENAKIEFVGLEMSERFSSLQENRSRYDNRKYHNEPRPRKISRFYDTLF